MSEMKLMFKSPDEICEFVNTVSRFDYDVDIRRGRVVVDAKSLLGLMELGINSVLELRVHADECGELTEALERCRKEMRSENTDVD